MTGAPANGQPMFDLTGRVALITGSSRGLGLASEGTLAVVEWALDQPGIVAVQATTFTWHAASLRVIHKLGMTRVGARDHDTLGELAVFERRR